MNLQTFETVHVGFSSDDVTYDIVFQGASYVILANHHLHARTDGLRNPGDLWLWP